MHLVNGEQYSGLERVLDHLAERAPAYGYRFHLVCLKPAEMPGRLQTRQAVIHRVPMRSRWDLSVARRVAALAREIRPCLLHSHTVRSAAVTAAVRTRVPLPWLHHVHSPARFECEDPLLNRVNHLFERLLLGRADLLLPVSSSLARYLERYHRTRADRVRIVTNGVPAVAAAAGPAATRPLPTVGAIGLFRPRKGIETLLHAIHLLDRSGLRLRLRLIGEFVSPAYLEQVRALIVRLELADRVILAGFCPEPAEEIAGLDIVVIPSLYGEGLPMVLLEAMAQGKAIVASAVDGITDVTGDGQAALLVPPGDAPALGRALTRLLDDPDLAHRIRTRARTLQRTGYSATHMAERLFAIYGLMGRPSPNRGQV